MGISDGTIFGKPDNCYIQNDALYRETMDMDKKEEIFSKVNLLKRMDTLIKEDENEDSLDTWLFEGIPEDSTEEDLIKIAKDRKEFRRISYLFKTLAFSEPLK